MRIVGGKLGGRRIAGPRGQSTRPTSERVREGIASALVARDYVRDAVVLDLFAGTGALSFEALSRGAARAVLIDRDAAMCRAIRSAATELDLADRTVTLQLDLARTGWIERLPGGDRFHLVFADPPYADVALVADLLTLLRTNDRLGDEAAIVIEHATKTPPMLPDGFSTLGHYRYGDTAVLLCTAPAREES